MEEKNMEKCNTIEISMDRRENRGIEEKLEEFGADVKISTLEIGDFLLSKRVVCERKTREDFESSIIDGRLFRQLGRMREAYPRSIVVVEGAKQGERLSRNAHLGAYASILADFGASLFFTNSSKSTAELLYAIAKYEQTGPIVPEVQYCIDYIKNSTRGIYR